MWRPELIRNKLYAILLIACTLPIMLLESDATATVFCRYDCVADVLR